jgi:hypothetical protein
MTAEGAIYQALGEAYRAALVLTGSTEVAENAVLNGIAASECGHIADDVLRETVSSAIQQRTASSVQVRQPPSHFPLELRRLFLLAPISRDCFVLRVLLGMTVGTCSRILHLGIAEIEEVLSAALQELPLLEACGTTECEESSVILLLQEEGV